jgi:hypothetical protein
VIGASRDRYETERLGERDGTDMNANGANDDDGKAAEAPHILHLHPPSVQINP